MMSVESQSDGEYVNSKPDAEGWSSVKTNKLLAKNDVTLEADPNLDLQQRHVVNVMLEDDRPSFSPYQIKSRLKNDPSKQTVRRRLNELVELGVVDVDEYRNQTLYYINDPRSQYAVPGDLNGTSAPADVAIKDLVTFRAPETLKSLVGVSGLLSLYLLFLGVALDTVGVGAPLSSTNQFVTAAVLIIGAAYPLLIVQRLVDRVRKAIQAN